MKKLLPLVLMLIGAGAGVGAGIFLRPEAVDPVEAAAEGNPDTTGAAQAAPEAEDDHEPETSDDPLAHEYVKLNNQFVVPIVTGDRVTALVVLALSLEVPTGRSDGVYQREPKLRDSFLQVLFDHANIGGFEGNFTDAQVLGRLRMALREVAQKDLGRDLVKDVLIVEIARQDY